MFPLKHIIPSYIDHGIYLNIFIMFLPIYSYHSFYLTIFTMDFSAKSLKEMVLEGSPEAQEVEEAEAEICPVNAAPIDCTTLDLTFRPISELCNNLLSPTVGNSDIAQLRLAPALFENCKSNN